jgi:hypothetical protein
MTVPVWWGHWQYIVAAKMVVEVIEMVGGGIWLVEWSGVDEGRLWEVWDGLVLYGSMCEGVVNRGCGE